ncbi:MAG: hypothetical protein JXA09_10610 [Anaerolineae bacterium]|nr:hypothetical protein [Anaerolineae bacterium]
MAIPSESTAVPRTLLVLFWVEVTLFVLVMGWILIDPLRELIRPAFLPLLGASLLVGVALLVLAIRWEARGLLRTFWILTGASITGLALGSVLHNVFYALGTVTDQWPVLHGALGVLEGATLLIAVLVSPLGFLAGVIGAVVVLAGRASASPAPSP